MSRMWDVYDCLHLWLSEVEISSERIWRPVPLRIVAACHFFQDAMMMATPKLLSLLNHISEIINNMFEMS